jgi:hypothetical protein
MNNKRKMKKKKNVNSKVCAQKVSNGNEGFFRIGLRAT